MLCYMDNCSFICCCVFREWKHHTLYSNVFLLGLIKFFFFFFFFFINDLLTHRDKRTQIDTAFLDFSNAFDTVPHQRLLGKLSFYWITGRLLNWIAAFLKDRHQSVVVEGMTSGQLDSGVPHGSVLGPLLFLPHINDLPSVVIS